MENVEQVIQHGLKSVASQIADEFAAQRGELDAKVAELNEKLAKKGEDVATIREQVAKLVAKEGKLKTEADALLSFDAALQKGIAENFDRIKDVSNGNKVAFGIEAKDMTLGANLTGSGVAQYSLTPSLRGRRRVHFREIPGVQVIPTATGIWKYFRNNPPASTGSFGTQVEGEAKAQIDFNWQEITTTVATEAGFSRVSRQMLRDLPFLQNFLPGELQEDYLRHEDNKFINNLMAATSASSLTATVYAEKLIEALSVVMGRDYDATAIVTTAGNWATLLNTKPSDYSLPGGSAVAVTADGSVTIAGVPVVVHNGMTAGRTFVGDFSRVKIIQATGLQIQFFEQDSDNVQKNMVTVRAEADVALAVLRSDWGLYFS